MISRTPVECYEIECKPELPMRQEAATPYSSLGHLLMQARTLSKAKSSTAALQTAHRVNVPFQKHTRLNSRRYTPARLPLLSLCTIPSFRKIMSQADLAYLWASSLSSFHCPLCIDKELWSTYNPVFTAVKSSHYCRHVRRRVSSAKIKIIKRRMS